MTTSACTDSRFGPAPPHRGPGAAAFASGRAAAAGYARAFAPLCAGTVEPLLSALGVTTRDRPDGQRLLDVGTGTGTLAQRAHGYGVAVTAVEPAPDLLDLASAALRQDQGPAGRPPRTPPVTLLRAALPHLPFADGRFPVVAANFVVNHVPDPRAAATELARVTAPGGRVGVTIWPADAGGQAALFAAVLADVGVEPPPGARLPEELDFPRSVVGLQALLEGAGLEHVHAQAHTWTPRTDPRALWSGVAAGVSGFGRVLAAQPDALRARTRAAYRRRTERHVGPDGLLALPTTAVLAVGTA